jgi:hypothetical protein
MRPCGVLSFDPGTTETKIKVTRMEVLTLGGCSTLSAAYSPRLPDLGAPAEVMGPKEPVYPSSG